MRSSRRALCARTCRASSTRSCCRRSRASASPASGRRTRSRRRWIDSSRPASDRPTSRSIGLWLESLFGADRATLKKAIAQGSEVEAALNRLPSFDGDRVPFGENTDRAPSRATARPGRRACRGRGRRPTPAAAAAPVGPTGAAHRRRRPRPRAPTPIAAAVAGARDAGADGIGARAARRQRPCAARWSPGWPARWSSCRRRSSSLARARRSRRPWRAPVVTTATLTLSSEPPGAQIFIDGDPSGMTTPSTLTGLRARRPIEVRLDKIGFRPVTEKIELMPGETRSRSFRLVEDDGTVVLEGLPPQAMIYVDDKQTEARGRWCCRSASTGSASRPPPASSGRRPSR